MDTKTDHSASLIPKRDPGITNSLIPDPGIAITMQDALIFFTSPNLCQCTTVWNTDGSDCYITLWLFVSDCSLLHHQFDRGCRMV